MADKIIVVGDREMALGFSLAGIAESHAIDEASAEKTLNELFARPDAGIIILQDKHYNALPPKAKRLVETTSKPVVVTVGTLAASTAEDLQRLIKRAIGITLEK